MKPPGLFSLLREDLRAHHGAWLRPGFQALAVYRFGFWKQRIRWRLLRIPFSLLHHCGSIFCRNFYGIELPCTVKIGRRLVLEHQHGITIHGNVVIGDDCVIRQGVTIGNRHLNDPFGAPVLGNHVNIGAGAKVLGRIHLGDHVNVGANAVVLSSVPAHTTVAGIPAKPVKRRKEAEATSPNGKTEAPVAEPSSEALP
ncbi:MAG: serine acetyltransferase [Planctomycetota bacterium]|nr:MAG: serine acetyltransferase [Planctomycetota bacterium]